MYELNQAGERTFYIDAPAKIGIYLTSDSEAYLIDSGNDKDAGKKVLRVLGEKGWTLRGIINTHSHADHIGGNRYLQQQTGCKVFASGVEAAFARYPILEPSLLYGGYPCADLRHKFLLAQESEVSDISDPDFPRELEVIPLKGHFFDMIGIRTPDDVLFLADCVSSKATLEKYQVSFIYDVAAYLETLDRVEAMRAKLFVPAHADATADMTELVQANRSKVFEIADKLAEILATPMCFEEILKRVFDEYRLVMNFEQYALVGSTVRSYLAWMKDGGRVGVEISDNRLLWHS